MHPITDEPFLYYMPNVNLNRVRSLTWQGKHIKIPLEAEAIWLPILKSTKVGCSLQILALQSPSGGLK